MSAVLSFPLDSPVLEQPLAGASPEALFRAPRDFISIRGVRLPRRRARRPLPLRTRAARTPATAVAGRSALPASGAGEHLPPGPAGARGRRVRHASRRRLDRRQEQATNRRAARCSASRWARPRSCTSTSSIPAGSSTGCRRSAASPYLLPDPKLFGGGLHESRTGATFAVHRDFNRHRHLGLKNEMVFITYLNKGWDPDWGSGLELWDKKQTAA